MNYLYMQFIDSSMYLEVPSMSSTKINSRCQTTISRKSMQWRHYELLDTKKRAYMWLRSEDIAQNIINRISPAAILFFASKKISPADSDSGLLNDDESTKKVHNDATACLFTRPLD